ncbi:hypothetical protein L1987_78873 [Smallanthus sonchifolius]|uniref:Uncharacterized protein n=1 Tax=Smallanthus sonchifolius TaxID=185202 RepID=A0ACB8ZDV0_9ASTR|nr:hypothetical protein L1987_78873 [Smallanthus sonchifolius]
MEQESNSIADDSTRSKIDEDYITKLPDDVLRRILLIHPLDSGSNALALLTGFLDRPWITIVKVQDFESTLGDFIVNFHKRNPLKMPRKLEFHLSKDLIITASIGLNKKLNLDFSKGNQEFPRQLGWEVMLKTMGSTYLSRRSFSIKTLKITSVNYLSLELVSSLISKFRNVKSLIIEKCGGLRRLRVEGAKLTNLSVLDCVDLKSVYVKASELKSFRYSGFICGFSFNYKMSLEHVKLDIKGPGFNQLNRGLYNPLIDIRGPWFNHLNHRLYNPLLQEIPNVNTLTLHGWMFKEVFGPFLSSKPYKKHFKFSNLEDLCWIDSCMEDHNINALFGFLTFCNSLKRLFISIDTRSNSKPCVDEHKGTVKFQKGRLRNLKVVKVKGFRKEVDLMLFKEHLMEEFNVEPRMIEVRNGMHERRLIRIPRREAADKVPKSEKLKYTYKFVEVVKKNKGFMF